MVEDYLRQFEVAVSSMTLDIDPTQRPMMNEYEVTLIEKLFDSRHDMECLEWGSGNSSFWFPKHRAVAHWTAIENNPEYAEYVSSIVYSIKTKVLLKPELYEYVNAVDGQKFDFILVDGFDGSRELCLERAFVLAKPDALILLHDSGRTEYQHFINKYYHYKLCDGEIPYDNGFFAHRGLTLFPVQ
jgi:predicted O-methyltransferase YrrM